jgi:hypothetical protein
MSSINNATTDLIVFALIFDLLFLFEFFFLFLPNNAIKRPLGKVVNVSVLNKNIDDRARIFGSVSYRALSKSLEQFFFNGRVQLGRDQRLFFASNFSSLNLSLNRDQSLLSEKQMSTENCESMHRIGND